MIETLEMPTACVDQVPAKPTATVIRICCYCGIWMGGAAADSGLPVSHGVCDPCMSVQMAELAAMKLSREGAR